MQSNAFCNMYPCKRTRFSLLIACFDADVRKGKYQFGHYGTYDGEWLRGKVHGRGTFVNHDGTTFFGDWNSQLGAGFGEIKPQNVNDPHEGGWEFVLPGGNVKEVKSDVFSRDEGLTERDVKLLLQGATVKAFKKGDVIKNEGDVNESLYRIKSGTISLQKNIDGQRKVLAEMTTEQMFGEMSILDKNIIRYATSGPAFEIHSRHFLTPFPSSPVQPLLLNLLTWSLNALN
jgi:hypothetical protein